MTPATRNIVESAIAEILNIKNRMEKLAIQMGYSQACKQGIPVCRGECCIYHYPKDLTSVDFFIAIYTMSDNRQQVLLNLVLQYKGHGCPMLLETGCFFSFEQRPVICTNAYPCFAGRVYWEKKEAESVRIKKIFEILSPIVLSPPSHPQSC